MISLYNWTRFIFGANLITFVESYNDIYRKLFRLSNISDLYLEPLRGKAPEHVIYTFFKIFRGNNTNNNINMQKNILLT